MYEPCRRIGHDVLDIREIIELENPKRRRRRRSVDSARACRQHRYWSNGS